MTAIVGFALPPQIREEHAMPLYRFHLYNDEETLDLEGRTFSDLEAAREDAVRTPACGTLV